MISVASKITVTRHWGHTIPRWTKTSYWVCV